VAHRVDSIYGDADDGVEQDIAVERLNWEQLC
jgi:hypothetical protein